MPEQTKKTKEFKPSANQLRALEYFQDQEYRFKTGPGTRGKKDKRVTVTEMVRAIGINNSTYHRWFASPDFAAWWVGEAEKFFVRQLTAVQGTLLEGATGKFTRTTARPSVAAIRTYLERFDRDFVPQSRQTISGDVSININISEIDDPGVPRPRKADEQPASESGH